MNIKSPACYDVSHWKEISDFTKVDPKPLLFITKASEAYPGSGFNHTDEKFIPFMTGFQSIGCLRGAYHFFRKAFDAKRQADHFLSVISKTDILSTDLLILDVEEGGEKASQLWVWFESVRALYPDNLLVLYSRANILNPIAMTVGEKVYFRKIWTWTAGYPFSPDLYSVCPSGYIPDQSKFGPVGLWQYSAHGAVTGIKGDVDLNWISPVFQAVIGTFEIGETMAINATGKCISSNNKVWTSIGGQVIGAFKSGDSVTIDQEQTVSGVKYVHVFNSSLRGWSKATWFQYSVVVAPPPDPDPDAEPEPTTLPDFITAHWVNGQMKKYVPE